MWERFTYYGMRGILILFLVDAVATGGFGLDDRRATAIYGLYTTATYLMALPGGWLADRLLGAQRAVVWGAALILVGNTLLAIPAGPTLFYLGCLVVVLGVGLLKPNISAMVAQLYPRGRRRARRRLHALLPGHQRRRTARLAGDAVARAAVRLARRVCRRRRRHGARARAVPADASSPGRRRQRARPTRAGRASQPTGGTGAGSGRARCRRAVVTALIATGVVTLDPTHVARWTAVAIVAVTVGYFVYLLVARRPRSAERRRVLVVLALFVVVGAVLGRLRTGGLVAEPVRGTVHRPHGRRLRDSRRLVPGAEFALHPAVRAGVLGALDSPRPAQPRPFGPGQVRARPAAARPRVPGDGRRRRRWSPAAGSPDRSGCCWPTCCIASASCA